jgi:hypothetical protein
MANQSSRKLEGVAKDILVRIRNTYILIDFVVLDMGQREEVPLLLGRPFLHTTNGVLHVGSGHACFHIQGQTIRCPFNGFDMNKHDKSKQPKKQPHMNIKQVWQAKKVQTSVSTPLGTDVPSSSKD